MKNDNLIASNKAESHLRKINSADILVGMPSFNNVVTAKHVVFQISKGLQKYFSDFKSVIYVSDGGSNDNTLTSVKETGFEHENIKLIPTLYIGASGKGSAVQAIFEAARFLKVKSVALVDSDLRSITPEWIQLLIDPTMNGTDFIAPIYNRHKYDGTITNFLCYPITTALYGKNIRQPIGGDFGLSIKLVEEILDSPIWNYPYVNRFGIDIFETHTALAKKFNIKQAHLGVKSHDPKDPSSQLAGMFRQVIGTMFTCAEKYRSAWKDIRGISETEKIGQEKISATPDAINVSLTNTINAYKQNYNNYTPFYTKLLSKEIQSKFEKLKNLESVDIDFPTEFWAKTVYAFMAEFRKEHPDPREKLFLLDALRILWIGRVAAFMKLTWNEDEEEAEEKIREETMVFTKLKPELIEYY